MVDRRRALALILLDDDDDDYEYDDEPADERGNILTVSVEDWKRLGDPEFRRHFRMDREVFEVLVVAVGNHLRDHGKMVRRSKNEKGLDFSLMMVLWILATPDSFRSVGVKFGLREGSVHFHYKYIIEALREMAPKYVQWPDIYEREVIAAAFEEKYGYPSVIGCIDGCLIKITAPLEQPDEYIDWHRNHSINLQGVCDDMLLFRDMYIGEPGSVGDKRTFKRSPLGRQILQDNVMSDKHLVGDGGYTLTSKLLIPYRDNGNLTQRMKTHNYYLSRCRSSIERAFALLKGKWRRLKYFQNYCIEYAVDHIAACVVLHNFIILQGNRIRGENMRWVDGAAPNYQQQLRQAKANGVLKRDYIAALLDPRN